MSKRRRKSHTSPARVTRASVVEPAPAPTKRRSILALIAVAVIIAVVGISLWRPWQRVAAPTAVASAAPPKFTGSEACAGCHARETQAWAGSQHTRAMREATESSVAGDFAHRKFEHGGSAFTFFKRDGKFFVRTDGPDAKPADFEIKYTFGVEPLQQYLVELPGGRLQALTTAWDTVAKRWFTLYPGEKLPVGDELHWTGRMQNWNFMCADCHSTDLRKQYDASANTFATTWSEIHVGCESCHGPGSNHLAWAQRRDADPGKGLTVALDERAGATWSLDAKTGNAARSRSRDTDKEIEVCAQCHSRRAQIGEGYHAGKPFLDYYLPALLTPPLYYADGQQRDEVYNWGSFLQSRMYRHGVTCGDCHEPHSAKLRVEGNALCAQCHSAEKYDSAKHHFHQASSPGARCVNCHMPETNYMVVDPRRDHSMRVPRPDLTVTLGVPNPCNRCHDKNDAKWAADTVRKWYGHDAQGMQSFALTFRNAELGKPAAGASLAAVAGDASQSPIARASALDRLHGDPASVDAARGAARNSNPLLRLAAANVADLLPPADRIAIAGTLLTDPLRAIRIEAANALAGATQDQLGPEQRAAWQRAADEYVASQRYNADRPEARTNLGSFYARLGRYDDASAEFRAALKLDPHYVPAYVNGADALRQQGREEDAVRTLRDGIAAVPGNASLHHALGLAYVRAKQRPEALLELSRAAQLAPDSARYTYVYAVALNSFGQGPAAIRLLERATVRWPDDRDMLLALITMERDAGRKDEARKAAEVLVALDPRDREARTLLEQLK